MKTKTIIAAAVFAVSLCGSSDLLAQSKSTYTPSRPTYTPSRPAYTPSKPAYTPSRPAYIAPKREPLYKETSRESWSRKSYNDSASQQNWRNGR